MPGYVFLLLPGPTAQALTSREQTADALDGFGDGEPNHTVGGGIRSYVV
jgi:hypothetical protein